MVGFLCMGRNRADSNLAVHFDFFFSLSNFLSVDIDRICVRSHLRRNKAVTSCSRPSAASCKAITIILLKIKPCLIVFHKNKFKTATDQRVYKRPCM